MGAPGQATPRILAQGDGCTVADVLCTSGPHDRPFEEQHRHYTIALVMGGSFQYRGRTGCELMAPGSLVLGNAGESFECGHQHAAGDRCLAFWYTPECFEQLAADAGARDLNFPVLRLPPLKEFSSLAARALAAFNRERRSTDASSNKERVLEGSSRASEAATWEELGLALAARVIRRAKNLAPSIDGPFPSSVARVTRAVRMIEAEPDGNLTLTALAAQAGLSPYHFLRVFEQLTGLTPHQYVLRSRLRQAGAQLASGSGKILDVAFDCGFGDVSNFNRAFRAEFSANPRRFRTPADCKAAAGRLCYPQVESRRASMHYLLKTEPSEYSFADLEKSDTTIWDGVSNPVALRHLREMQKGAKLVIYHTGDEKSAVGTATVESVDAADPKNPRVKIKAGRAIAKPRTLADIKSSKLFAESPLVRQGRLSVVPLTAQQYDWLTGA